MAVDIHVVAARNAPIAALRQALAETAMGEPEESNDWLWSTGHLYESDDLPLRQKLQQLGTPVLWARTQGASTWALRLIDRDDFCLETWHDFSYLHDPPPSLRRLIPWQARAVAGALDRLQMPFEPRALRGALTGSSVPEEELLRETGNLPRFLAALGLGDVLAGRRDELESALVIRERTARGAAPALLF
jgi:hypothetical protein